MFVEQQRTFSEGNLNFKYKNFSDVTYIIAIFSLVFIKRKFFSIKTLQLLLHTATQTQSLHTHIIYIMVSGE